MRKGPKRAVSVLIPLHLFEQIKIQSEQKERAVSSYIRQVLRCYMWHVENAPESLVDEWNVW